MQVTCSVVALQPILDKPGAAIRVARLEETMDALVRRMSIARIAGERALDQPRPLRNLTGFDIALAEIAEEPPVFAPARRQLFEQSQLRLVMIAPPAEAQQPENAERQR
jgi:hypothetical protein